MPTGRARTEYCSAFRCQLGVSASSEALTVSDGTPAEPLCSSATTFVPLAETALTESRPSSGVGVEVLCIETLPRPRSS